MKSVADKLGVSLIEFNKVRNELASIDAQSATDSVSRLLPSNDTLPDPISNRQTTD